jgi:hypothetical protein
MPNFKITIDTEDVTMNGLFGARPDTSRVYVAGLKHYFIDDVEVTKEAYDAAIQVYLDMRLTDPPT